MKKGILPFIRAKPFSVTDLFFFRLQHLLHRMPPQHRTFHSGWHMGNVFQYRGIFELIHFLICHSALIMRRKFLQVS